jgi:hypothetical protein
MSLCKQLHSYPGASDPFAPGSHVGLDFAYGAGKVRSNNVVTHVTAGDITLVDDVDNYIEIDPSNGAVSSNTTGYTTGKLPLYKITTVSGEITEVRDDRCFFSVGGSGGGGGSLEDSGWGHGVLVDYSLVLTDSGIISL